MHASYKYRVCRSVNCNEPITHEVEGLYVENALITDTKPFSGRYERWFYCPKHFEAHTQNHAKYQRNTRRIQGQMRLW